MSAHKKQSFQYGAVILLFSAFAVKLIGALFKIPLSGKNCLGDIGFGYFSSAYDIFTPFYTMAMTGLPVAVAKLTAEYAAAGKYDRAAGLLKVSRKIYFAVGCAVFLIMCAGIYPFVKITDPTGDTFYSLAACFPSVIFCFVMSAYRGYYQGMRNMYPTAFSELAEALCKLILGLGFAYTAIKITGSTVIAAAAAISGITVGTAASFLVLVVYHTGENKLKVSDESKLSRKTVISFFAVAVPVAFASLSVNIPVIADAVTVKWQLNGLSAQLSDALKNLYPESLSEFFNTSQSYDTGDISVWLYGIRGKAYTLYNLIPAFVSVLAVSAVPAIATDNASGGVSAAKGSVETVLKWSALISFPAGIGFIAAGEPVMELLYDTDASGEIGGVLLRIFGAAVIFSGISIPMTGILQAFGKQKKALLIIAAGAAVKFIVSFITVSQPEINIAGAAISTLACYAFIFAVEYYVLIKTLGAFPDIIKTFIKPLTAACLSGTAAFLILVAGKSSLITVLAIAVSALTFFLALILLNSFEESDFLSMPKGEKIIQFCKKCKIIR